MNKSTVLASFLAVVALPGLAGAETWTNFATGNGAVNEVERGVCIDGYIAGLKVKEQAGFGIIDVSLVCRTDDGQLHETEDWIVDNRAASVVKGPDNCPEKQVVKGLVAREQAGFGVVDIKIVCGNLSEKPELTNTREGITQNTNGVDQPAIHCPPDSNPFALMTHEQHGYGVVNYKLFCR